MKVIEWMNPLRIGVDGLYAYVIVTEAMQPTLTDGEQETVVPGGAA